MLSLELINKIENTGWKVKVVNNEVIISFNTKTKHVFSETFLANDKEFIDGLNDYQFIRNEYLCKKLRLNSLKTDVEKTFNHYDVVYDLLVDLAEFAWNWAEKNGSPSIKTIKNYWEFDAFDVDDDNILHVTVKGPEGQEVYNIKNYRGRLEDSLDWFMSKFDLNKEIKNKLNVRNADINIEELIDEAYEIENAIKELKSII